MTSFWGFMAVMDKVSLHIYFRQAIYPCGSGQDRRQVLAGPVHRPTTHRYVQHLLSEPADDERVNHYGVVDVRSDARIENSCQAIKAGEEAGLLTNQAPHNLRLTAQDMF